MSMIKITYFDLNVYEGSFYPKYYYVTSQQWLKQDITNKKMAIVHITLQLPQTVFYIKEQRSFVCWFKKKYYRF